MSESLHGAAISRLSNTQVTTCLKAAFFSAQVSGMSKIDQVAQRRGTGGDAPTAENRANPNRQPGASGEEEKKQVLDATFPPGHVLPSLWEALDPHKAEDTMAVGSDIWNARRASMRKVEFAPPRLKSCQVWREPLFSCNWLLQVFWGAFKSSRKM
jgi:hypothetical protein